MTIAESLQTASKKLGVAGVSQPAREASSLLMHAIGRDLTFLIAHPEYELTTDEKIIFESYITRRQTREPFQHIVGKQEFYGLDFIVSPDVLIPRPETELLVEMAIDSLRGSENPRFCEVGVGSGCISVSILHELPKSTAVGLDISKAAINVARKNAANNGVVDRIEFLVSDILGSVELTKFDAIVSNPPYIPFADIPNLQPEVRDFDPSIALTDGGDGLTIIRRIICDAPNFLRPRGFLVMEIGIGQADDVRKMLSPLVWDTIEFYTDLQAIPRTVRASLK